MITFFPNNPYFKSTLLTLRDDEFYNHYAKLFDFDKNSNQIDQKT